MTPNQYVEYQLEIVEFYIIFNVANLIYSPCSSQALHALLRVPLVTCIAFFSLRYVGSVLEQINCLCSEAFQVSWDV